VSAPTTAEIDAIAEAYRGWLNLDAQHAPSAEAKKHLTHIETATRKLLDSIAGADQRALDSLAWRIGEAIDTERLALVRSFDYSAPLGRTLLDNLVRLAKIVTDAAHQAHDDIPKVWPKSAQRVAATSLRDLFAKHGLKFTATVDGYGATSHAVATLLDVARRAGDAEMTIDAARKWIEFAIREKVPPKSDDGFPIP